MRRSRLILGDTNVLSRRWSLWVNTVASSPLVSKRVRAWMYRRAGVATQTDDIAPRCYIHSSLITIGRGAVINNHVHIQNVAPVTIGERVGLGIRTVVLTGTHDIGPEHTRMGPWRREPVTIEDGCWLGARCTVLPGVRIGRGCIVAAGAVVAADCEPNGLYAGVPARRVKDLE